MKKFTEYRSKDYQTPRSMQEAYGFKAPLYIKSKPDMSGWFLVGAILWVVIWVGCGWL
jgi:hypothetical protein